MNYLPEQAISPFDYLEDVNRWFLQTTSILSLQQRLEAVDLGRRSGIWMVFQFFSFIEGSPTLSAFNIFGNFSCKGNCLECLSGAECYQDLRV